ncbi:hypothetical protein ASPVEDRAFT_79459 [Aspergillus versicolor CBS 583.65]|uniref:Yeast cell wall synthesis Kre9/Knh1-like N-terminal domain-containing protein n=1 Tax=Aspergillus versicolor CBS 583.65 TaxID=1036611 RepID=A0A1L9P8B5_ASPVE|nr:uncharacterized protein ASPVEDRAFT_79459 [Aspergillus versicolor CBS 583.65]OJI97769.1 hypothetical protein ASPVEDRAFT_79459 [Aspergillus versicolor CBS 583.65]
MRSVFFLALSAVATLAAARENAFNIPKDGYEFTAGESTTLKWAPSTEGTVTLRLQRGDVFDSSTGTVIASNIANSGSYTWSVPKDIAEHGDYTVEIVSDSDPDSSNYLPQFSVQGAAAATTASESESATPTPETTTTETSSSSTSTDTTTSTSTTTESSSSASPTPTSTSSESPSETPASTTSTESSSSSTESPSSSPSSSIPSVDDGDNAGMANRVSGGLLALALGVAALV